MTEQRELEISPLLQECFTHTETACVSGCCGFDAFEPTAAAIQKWAESVGSDSTAQALREIRELINLCEDRSFVSESSFLNAGTYDESARLLSSRFFGNMRPGFQ